MPPPHPPGTGTGTTARPSSRRPPRGDNISAAITLLNHAEPRGDFNTVEERLKDIIMLAARYGATNEWRKLGQDPPP